MRSTSFTLAAWCVVLGHVAVTLAQEAPVTVADTPLEAVTVTASRVRRDGYEAPTPTTVLTADDLTLRASNTLGDLLAQLPQMRNPDNESTGGEDFAHAVGRGFVNLRGLGTNRTLVLLDGERLVSNDLDGDRDTLTLPAALIKSVDVVTGGASALYGSDAVAGVVNFVLDTQFTGFKANVEGGTSQRSDGTEGKVSVAWGGDLGDRWHLIASAEFFNQDGVSVNARSFASPPGIVPNPDYTAGNGERPLEVVDNAYNAETSTGGLILNGPLAGQTFQGNGSTASYVPSGCSVSQPYVLCHSQQQSLAQPIDPISMTTPQQRVSAFERLTFQVTPDLETHLDTMLAHVDSSLTAVGLSTSDFGFQIPISVADNPYLPASVRSAYLAAGIPTLYLGRENQDEGTFEDEVHESEANVTLGMSANLGASWQLKAHAMYGVADTGERWDNAYSIDRFLNAVDVVSVNGTATCRINAVTVTDPGCAPANVFGSGNLSAAAKAYFTGEIDMPLKTKQREVGADLTGEPLTLWAGPVSVAAGASYREERARQFNNGETDDYAFSGLPPLAGETVASELYTQAVLPLARDLPFAKSVEFDLAARWVHYSQAGTEWPWKLGLNWVPVQGFRFRVSESEDIRAPNIAELDQPQYPSATETVVNPTGRGVPLFDSLGIAPGESVIIRQIGGGNPNLKPEIAHTSSAGVVLEPASMQGLTASLDYFRIRIDDAITTLDAQPIVQACAAGDATECQLISVGTNSTLPNVATISTNAQSFLTSGLDSEIRYTFALAGGQATLRALANYVFDYQQAVPGVSVEDLLGDLSNGLPRLQGDLTAEYRRGATTAFVAAQYIGGGDYSKALAYEIQNDFVPHVWYVNLTLDHKLQSLCGECSVYVSIDNLFDQDPPSPGFGIYTTTASSFFTGVPYDRVGRYFKLGFQLKVGGADAR